MTPAAGLLFFSANDGVVGTEPWTTDGTTTGTTLLADIVPGSGSSSPSGFTVLNGAVFFAANDPVFGRELFLLPCTTAPGEVSGLVFTTAEDLTWDATGPIGTRYDVVRGALAELPAGTGLSETCVEDDSPDNTSSVPDDPFAGDGYWYLVRADNACGAGTYGVGTSAQTRLPAACS
jgi:ELWxxDGT repeat protein